LSCLLCWHLHCLAMNLVALMAFAILCISPGGIADDRGGRHRAKSDKSEAIVHRLGSYVDAALAANKKVVELMGTASALHGGSSSTEFFLVIANAWQTCREADGFLQDATHALDSYEDHIDGASHKKLAKQMRAYLESDSVSGQIDRNCAKTQKIINGLYGREEQDDPEISVGMSWVISTVAVIVAGVSGCMGGLATLASCGLEFAGWKFTLVRVERVPLLQHARTLLQRPGLFAKRDQPVEDVPPPSTPLLLHSGAPIKYERVKPDDPVTPKQGDDSSGSDDTPEPDPHPVPQPDPGPVIPMPHPGPVPGPVPPPAPQPAQPSKRRGWRTCLPQIPRPQIPCPCGCCCACCTSSTSRVSVPGLANAPQSRIPDPSSK